ncbi:MAG: hypothetical protein WAO20_15490 [Acidobacteriota bacterium]
MLRHQAPLVISILLGLSVLILARSAYGYEHFKVAVYARAYEVREMGDPAWLQSHWEALSAEVHVDKVYLETHRDLIVVDEKTIRAAQEFFRQRGIQTAGGITLTVNERNRFETFCYSNPEHRKKVREIVEYTARLFDEIILDDFFFTNCKCALCIRAKGNRSWTDFRLSLMTDAARELVVGPARAVNPRVKVVIKYPNWYEHFQGLGFNLETEPAIFDGLYTGTETRDAVFSNQHLQQYEGFLIFRYFENIQPGRNGGGWVDTGGLWYLDRYAEQLWLTLFAKAPEVTLFDIRQLQRPLRAADRAAWQGTGTSFDFDEMMKPVPGPDGKPLEPSTIARAAGYTFEKVDRIAGELGRPIGLPSYRPFHATGEDFLQNYLGMIGIPMDLVPEFPVDAPMVLLTESAKFDDSIVEKIRHQLLSGKSVCITSGLLRALENRGLGDIVELRYTDRKARVKDFVVGFGRTATSDSEILIPEIQYLTNDSWEEVSALAGPNGFPILHSAGYAGGTLYVLTIPENFADLYQLPSEVLGRIRSLLLGQFYVRLEGPSLVSLFVYDNDTFIVESFRDEPIDVRLVVDARLDSLRNLQSGETLAGQKRPASPWIRGDRDRVVFQTEIKPHSFQVLRGSF